MEFGFTPEQDMLRESVRRFMAKECTREYIRACSDNDRYPLELYAKMAAQGWMGIPFPEEYGGAGLGPMELAIVAEEMARFSPSISTAYYMAIWGVLNIVHYGSQEHKDYFLPRVNAGKQNFSFSMTEPDSVSDAASLRTRAVLDGDEWVINGEKVFSTQSAAREMRGEAQPVAPEATHRPRRLHARSADSLL